MLDPKTLKVVVLGFSSGIGDFSGFKGLRLIGLIKRFGLLILEL